MWLLFSFWTFREQLQTMLTQNCRRSIRRAHQLFFSLFFNSLQIGKQGLPNARDRGNMMVVSVPLTRNSRCCSETVLTMEGQVDFIHPGSSKLLLKDMHSYLPWDSWCRRQVIAAVLSIEPHWNSFKFNIQAFSLEGSSIYKFHFSKIIISKQIMLL